MPVSNGNSKSTSNNDEDDFSDTSEEVDEGWDVGEDHPEEVRSPIAGP